MMLTGVLALWVFLLTGALIAAAEVIVWVFS